MLKHFHSIFLCKFFIDKPVNDFINSNTGKINGCSITGEKANVFFYNAISVLTAEYGVVFGNERPGHIEVITLNRLPMRAQSGVLEYLLIVAADLYNSYLLRYLSYAA